MKYLIGLHYENDDETNKSIRFAEQNLDLRWIGFELTDHYMEHRRNLLHFPIISDIANDLIPRRNVLFLEDELLVNEMRAIETAQVVYNGKITREKIETHKDQCFVAITPQSPPEQDYSYNRLFAQCDRALTILDGGKDIEQLLKNINMERRAVIRDTITKHSIDIAFVSFTHVEKIAEGLSGYIVKDVCQL